MSKISFDQDLQQINLFLQTLRSTKFDEDCRELSRIYLKLLSNILLNPGFDKFRTIRPRNKIFIRLTDIYNRALDFLFLIGFEEMIVQGEKKLVLSRENEKFGFLYDVFELVKNFAIKVNLPIKEIPDVNQAKGSFEAVFGGVEEKDKEKNGKEKVGGKFDYGVSNVVSLHPLSHTSTNTNEEMEKKVEELKRQKKEMMLNAGIPAREIIVVPHELSALLNATMSGIVEDENDKKGKKGDANLVFEANKLREQKRKNQERWSTKAMRDFEKLKSERVYTKALIRIILPDRTIIQANFSPLETLSDLISLLTEEVFDTKYFRSLNGEFYLFTSPPKTVLHDLKATFEDLKMLPATNVYLSWGKVNVVNTLKKDLKTRSSVMVKQTELKAVDYSKLIKQKYKASEKDGRLSVNLTESFPEAKNLLTEEELAKLTAKKVKTAKENL